MQPLKSICYFALILVLLSCKSSKVGSNGGVVITFDDTFVEEWCATDALMSKYNWKATFCVSKINTFSDRQLEKLRGLQKKHEIAGHGLAHRNAVRYIKDNNIEKYLNDEIIPMNAIMIKESLNVKSFAYPGGNRNLETDSLLLNYYQILRGTSSSHKILEQNKCIFNNSPIVYGLGTDTSYEHFNEQLFLDLLHYAKEQDKVIVLYVHKPVNKVTDKYQTKNSTIDLICNYVNKNNMKFYTLSDLMELIE